MSLKDYGYSKIKAVEIERWDEDCQYPNEYAGSFNIHFALIWVVDVDGNVWERTCRTNEDLEQVAANLRKRGWTDDHCVLFREASL